MKKLCILLALAMTLLAAAAFAEGADRYAWDE